MNADQIRKIIDTRLPTSLDATIRRLGIKFTAETRILTQLTATLVSNDKSLTIDDMIAPEYAEQRVVGIITILVEAIERANKKTSAGEQISA